MPQVGRCVLQFARRTGQVHKQLLAQGLPSVPQHLVTIIVALDIVDVLPQWAPLQRGLPHQLGLSMLGRPKTGQHLDAHRHFATPPLLASYREQGSGEFMQRTSINIGVTTDGNYS